MKAIDREFIRLTGQIYLERLKKWPETEDDVRVTDSVRAASQIMREASSITCEAVYFGHDFSKINEHMQLYCSRCGKQRGEYGKA